MCYALPTGPGNTPLMQGPSPSNLSLAVTSTVQIDLDAKTLILGQTSDDTSENEQDGLGLTPKSLGRQ